MALLSLYEANMHMLDHPKKKSKIWIAISNGLKDFEIEMTCDQVRWKMNALQKRYKECCDNNNKSGRGTMDFKWYEQMDEIFGKNKDAIAAHTVSTSITKKKIESTIVNPTSLGAVNKASKNKSSVLNNTNSPLTDKASTSLSAADKTSKNKSSMLNNTSSPLNDKNDERMSKIIGRPLHGTGSTIASKKLQIEQKWLNFLENKEKRDAARDERQAKAEEKLTENLILKKQIISLKRKQMEQKIEIMNKKMKEKENRHAEIMKIEQTKCKLLSKLLSEDSTKSISDDFDDIF